LPFAHLNLCRNPFGELTPEERVDLAVVDAEAYAAHLRQPRCAVQFVGRCGTGKSTHLLAIAARLPECRYVRLDRGEPVTEGAVLILDEIGWLSRRARQRVFSRPSSFAIGSHHDLSEELRAAGLAVQTVPLGGITVGRLRAIVDRRIENCRRDPGPIPAIGDGALECLVRRHRDDIRAMESDLYDAFQQLRCVGDPVEICDGGV
jgi:hypothetical protein